MIGVKSASHSYASVYCTRDGTNAINYVWRPFGACLPPVPSIKPYARNASNVTHHASRRVPSTLTLGRPSVYFVLFLFQSKAPNSTVASNVDPTTQTCADRP